MGRQVIFSVVCFTAMIVCARAWFSERSKDVACPPKPNYNGCLFNTPCDPKKVNPCGCSHACCAPIKGYYIASKSSRAGLKSTDRLTNILPTYFCFKRGECNQRCGRIWKYFNDIDKCGCGAGLKCTGGNWLFDTKCRPAK